VPLARFLFQLCSPDQLNFAVRLGSTAWLSLTAWFGSTPWLHDPAQFVFGVAPTAARWPEWWTDPAVAALGPDWLRTDPESSGHFVGASPSPSTTEGANEQPPTRATSARRRGSSVPRRGGHTPRAPPMWHVRAAPVDIDLTDPR
jgi:hypothetical protein